MKLFFDPRLSANGTVACASCHNPARAFTDGRPTSVGFKGRVGQRNAPTILNALYNKKQFWTGGPRPWGIKPHFPFTGLNLAQAIASYERTLVSFDSPFDHFIDKSPLVAGYCNS
jgi:cytochrome c peroxidase